MRIIEPGIKTQQAPENTAEKYWWLDFTFKCKNCLCLFKLERQDFPKLIKVNQHTFEESITVNCPFCSTEILIRKPSAGSRNQSFTEGKFIKGGYNGSIFEEVFGKDGIFGSRCISSLDETNK